MTAPIEAFDFTRNGADYTARVYVDDSQDHPWDHEDGHGPVRYVRLHHGIEYSGAKRPGERVLHQDGATFWFYDWQAACKLARADGWNAEPYDAPGRIERAVLADFRRLGAYLREEWIYVGVSVTPEDEPETYARALWGIESDAEDYIREVADEIADEIHAEAIAARLAALPDPACCI